MKVAIVNLTGGDLSGGYRKYLQTMVPLMSADPRVERLAVFVPPGASWPELPAPTFAWTRADVRLGFRGLRKKLRDWGPDVVFVPTARWLDCGGTPVVAMVRNMEPLRVPFEGNPLTTKAKNVARALVAYHACRKAGRVIAVSAHVRDFLVRRWRIDPERVCVVSHGVEASGVPATARPPAMLEGQTERFVFTAGSIRPARGLRDIVEAAGRLKECSTFPHRIVIAGSADRDSIRYAADVRRFAERLGVAERISWVGRLDASQMAWCFGHCDAFVMTSWAEACPNTVLEAMSYGCLSVSTDEPPMPEFFGKSATYYRARDGSSLARQLLEALSATDDEKKARRDAAVAAASKYDWRTTAVRTVDELERARRPRLAREGD